LQKIPEQRDALCFHDEFSGIVRISEDYYKLFRGDKARLPTQFDPGGVMVEQQTQAATNGEPEFAAFVGIDWADKKHYWSLSTVSGHCERGTLDNMPEAVEAWLMELRRRFEGRPIAVALEQRKGALVVMLGKYDHAYLYPVHPRSLAKFREAFYPSGAKDDTKDADLLREILTKHRAHLRRLDPDTKEMRLLQSQVENRRKLVDERTALANKLKDTLKIYFPRIPRWFEDVSTELVCDLLARWPTLEELRKARPATVEKFFHQHRCCEGNIRQRLDDIRNAVAATRDEAVIIPSKHMIAAWVGQLAVLRQAIREIEREIADLAHRQEDWASLMAAPGTRRERFESADELQCFAGIAPVKEASGNSVWIRFRRACPKFLRQTFHEWAACSIPQCDWAKTYYDDQKARGKKHHAAVRALAFKWMRILYRCWKARQPYQESVYLASVAKRILPARHLAASVQMP
jgi:transposase